METPAPCNAVSVLIQRQSIYSLNSWTCTRPNRRLQKQCGQTAVYAAVANPTHHGQFRLAVRHYNAVNLELQIRVRCLHPPGPCSVARDKINVRYLRLRCPHSDGNVTPGRRGAAYVECNRAAAEPSLMLSHCFSTGRHELFNVRFFFCNTIIIIICVNENITQPLDWTKRSKHTGACIAATNKDAGRVLHATAYHC
jgi:hypothetical protein